MDPDPDPGGNPVNTGIRIFWLATLAFFLTGCASYRPAAMPGLGDPGDPPPAADSELVAPGDRVRGTVRGGETVEGVYVARDQASLTIVETAPRPVGYDESSDILPEDIQHVLPVAEIEQVERYDSSGDTALTIGVGVVAVALFAVGMSFKNSMENGFMSGK